jgi:hypothetical protein
MGLIRHFPAAESGWRGSIVAPLHNRNWTGEGLKNLPKALFCRTTLAGVVNNSD